MEVRQSVKLTQGNISKQTSSRRLHLLRRPTDSFTLTWLVLLSVIISAAAEVSSQNPY